MRRFQRLYNEERPHQALDNATPAEHYAASPRRYDGILREPDYGDRKCGGCALTARSSGAAARLRQRALAASRSAWPRSRTGWRVRYGPIVLGAIDHRGESLESPKRKGRGRVDNARVAHRAHRQQQLT